MPWNARLPSQLANFSVPYRGQQTVDTDRTTRICRPGLILIATFRCPAKGQSVTGDSVPGLCRQVVRPQIWFRRTKKYHKNKLYRLMPVLGSERIPDKAWPAALNSYIGQTQKQDVGWAMRGICFVALWRVSMSSAVHAESRGIGVCTYNMGRVSGVGRADDLKGLPKEANDRYH